MKPDRRNRPRTETERQALIAEYRRLRELGMNPPRQQKLLVELSAFELGWPESPAAAASVLDGKANGHS